VPDAGTQALAGERGRGAYLPTTAPAGGRPWPPSPPASVTSSPLALALWLSAGRRAAGGEEPLAVAAALVRAGADVNYLEPDTQVPLVHRRVAQGDSAGARFLLDSAACRVDQLLPPPAPLPEPWAPVPTAAAAAAGAAAAPTPTPDGGATPTSYATLLAGVTQTTVLHMAAAADMVEVVRAVLARPEAPANVVDVPKGETALHVAIRGQHEGIVAALLRRPPTLTTRYDRDDMCVCMFMCLYVYVREREREEGAAPIRTCA
jgi:hypothetical protein